MILILLCLIIIELVIGLCMTAVWTLDFRDRLQRIEQAIKDKEPTA